MNLDYVPLLQIQRDLHGLPRNYERFRQYLRTMQNRYGTDGMRIPLLIMNPMGKDHVTALLDALLALDADGIAARALAEASACLSDMPGSTKVALVVADDLKGGWTNRYAYEFDFRFRYAGVPEHLARLPRWVEHFWLTTVVWSSEPATEQAVREAILTAVYRAAYIHWHGPARTLSEKLRQEGHVMALAGCTGPVLDEEDIAYTREVLVPYLDAEDMRTTIECLFGDAAGRTLGFTPRGLSPWAGLALALHDARMDPALSAAVPLAPGATP
jgi:hypothetical protein